MTSAHNAASSLHPERFSGESVSAQHHWYPGTALARSIATLHTERKTTMSKTWLITGASSGFGRLLAQRVAANGDQVIAVARRAAPLQELAAASGGRVLPLVLDITSEQAGAAIQTAITAA